MNTPICYYGGKTNMLNIIKPLIPHHKIYNEPFTGGGALFFSKPSATVNVLNDKNAKLSAFYRAGRNTPKGLIKKCNATIFDENTYNEARKIYKSPKGKYTDLINAWAVFVGANMSYGGILFRGAYGPSVNKIDKGNSARTFHNKKINLEKNLKKLERSIIYNRDALKIITKHDTKHTFHYLDPPYVETNQGHYRGYSISDFIQLINTLKSCKGKFMLSCSLNSELELIIQSQNWIIKKYPQTLRLNNGKQEAKSKKIECLVMNYEEINLFNQKNSTR